MKTASARNWVFGLIGLLAWGLCILACTSFSPDDKKVLYPAFDAATGTPGVAIFDRETQKSTMLFVPIAYEPNDTNVVIKPQFVRSQWLPDGKSVLLAWAEESEKSGSSDVLKLAVTGVGTQQPLRLFTIPTLKDASGSLVTPLNLVNDHVYLMAGDQEILILDLKTGSLDMHEFTDAKGDFSIYPGPAGDKIFYIEELKESTNAAVFGQLNPADFSRTPIMTLTNDVKGLFTINQDGSRVGVVEEGAENQLSFVLLEKGKVRLKRPLGLKSAEIDLTGGAFNPKGDTVIATFARTKSGEADYGIIEIPLSDEPIRQTVLISNTPAGDKQQSVLFQAGLSHDGKTAAATSTYLAVDNEKFRAEDCALFFVDLTDPKRKITKVPIPLPAHHTQTNRKQK